MATLKVQCFPKGNVVTIARVGGDDGVDPWAPFQVLHKADPDQGDNLDELRDATPEEVADVRANVLARRYFDRDVLVCDTPLVGDLLDRAEFEDGDPLECFTWDNVSNLRPDPTYWDLSECKEWLDDKGLDLPDPNPWAMTRAELIEAHQDRTGTDVSQNYPDDTEVVRRMAIEAIDGDGKDEFVTALRDAVNDNAEDAEVYEWWRVSSWLANQLDATDECVLTNAYGAWWGRQATGQSVLMDGTLQAIARRHPS